MAKSSDALVTAIIKEWGFVIKGIIMSIIFYSISPGWSPTGFLKYKFIN